MNAYTIEKNANPDGSITILIGGTLSIETSGELHRALSDALDESQQVSVNLRALEGIDMTSMQIMCSACKSAAKMGRGYDYNSDFMPACLVSFISSIGGPQKLPCRHKENKPCIWFGGIQKCLN